MAVSNTNSFTGPYTANGATTVFPYNFTLLDEADLVVEVDGVAVNSGFSVSGVGDAAGGNVTFDTAPAADASVLLYRDVTLDRSTDYQYQGELPSDVLDVDFDRLWLAIQQIDIRSRLSLRVPLATYAGVSFEIPAPSANGYLRWNSTGTALENAVGSEAAAAASATAAATSATNAATSATSASTSATAASTSATAAATSATAAATSASNADSSATAAAASAAAAAAAGQGRLIDVQVYDAAGSSTWTRPAGMTSSGFVIVDIVGGGGAGMKADSVSSQASVGAGGNCGVRLQTTIPYSDLDSTATVTVGAGGAGSTSVVANSGGASSFASGSYTASAPGGGGSGSNISAGTSTSILNSGGTNATDASNTFPNATDIISARNPTAASMAYRLSGTDCGAGKGAPSPLTGTGGGAGGSGFGNVGNAGGAGHAPGAGGGGAQNYGTVATATAGGSGADGIVIVYTYA